MATTRKLDRQTTQRLADFLRDRRSRLHASLQARVTERRQSESRRSAEEATNAADAIHTDLEVTMLDRESREAVQIDAALERLAQGQYGICRDCGEFIGLQRLQALPFAQRCTTCQSRAEAGERAQRNHPPRSIRPELARRALGSEI